MNQKAHSLTLTSDAIVLTINPKTSELELLVVQRKYPPFQGQYCLPGGHAEEGEVPVLTCVREVREETGLVLDPAAGIPLQPRSRAGRDPRGQTLTIPFLFLLLDPKTASTTSIQAGDDAQLALFMPLTELPPLAFDHGAMLCEALAKLWQDFLPHHTLPIPSHSPLKQIATTFYLPQKLPSHLVFFGGTFDPWHPGHSACLEQFLVNQTSLNLKSEKTQSQQAVILVPDTNPHKTLRQAYTYTDAQGAKATHCAWQFLLKLHQKISQEMQAFQKQYIPFYLYPGFCGQEFPNTTSSWLPLIAQSNSLLMGDDSFRSLPRWHQPEKFLLRLKKIWVIPRLGNAESLQEAEAWVHHINPQLQVISLGNHLHQDQSSTQIRNLLTISDKEKSKSKSKINNKTKSKKKN